ncbi:hypothetical protein [Nonomuraea angiospora]
MIAVVWLLVAALTAAGLARAAHRRHWTLHTLISSACALILAVLTVFVALGGVITELPGWVNVLGIAVDALLFATMVDLSRARKREDAAREVQ